MESLSSVVSILTAMITPTVLISASAALILSTVTRLGRVADHVRVLSGKIEGLGDAEKPAETQKERLKVIFSQLDRLTTRARLLQRSIAVFHCAIGMFISTSILIGLFALTEMNLTFLPIATGFSGSCLLFYGSINLIYEARLSLLTINDEMSFIWHLANLHAPIELANHKKTNRIFAA